MGKGEIARYEQFRLFPQSFLKSRFPGASKGVIVWEWVKRIRTRLALYSRPDICFKPQVLDMAGVLRSHYIEGLCDTRHVAGRIAQWLERST